VLHRLGRLSVFALAALAAASFASGSHARTPATRNVLLIVVDDLNTDLGAYALRNLAGGVETNTFDVVQIEIAIGICVICVTCALE
jgi:hypothetical protein